MTDRGVDGISRYDSEEWSDTFVEPVDEYGPLSEDEDADYWVERQEQLERLHLSSIPEDDDYVPEVPDDEEWWDEYWSNYDDGPESTAEPEGL